MPWGKMDDKFHRNRKVRALRRLRGGRAAIGDWTFWWSWCLDDPDLEGVVPLDELDRDDMKSAALLVQVGLWDQVEGGYRFHDFDEYNPTREQVETKRAADRTRVAAKRAAESAASRADVASDTHANPPRVASTRVPSPSHPLPDPNPNPTESDARPVVEPISISLESALRAERPTLGTTSSAVAEAVEDHLVALGLKRVDTLAAQVRTDLVWIGAQPAADVVRVAASVLGDEWCKANFGLASSPGHLRRRWHIYTEGPKAAQQKRGMSEVADRAEYNEPDPEWMHDA